MDHQQVTTEMSVLWTRAEGAGSSYRAAFIQFLTEFKLDEATGLSHYMGQMLQTLREGNHSLSVDCQHVKEWEAMQAEYLFLRPFMCRNALLLTEEGLLREVAKDLVNLSVVKVPTEELQELEEQVKKNIENVSIVLVDWRDEPPSLRSIYPDAAAQLTTVTGTVTRTSGVRPELRSAWFSCDVCGAENGPIRQEFKFTEPPICRENCNNKRRWTRLEERCEYGDWQKLKLQENADEIPAGCLPRSMDIIMRGELVDVANAGDKLEVCGYLAVVPDVASTLAKGVVPKIILQDQARAGRQEMDASNNLGGVAGQGVRDLSCKTVFITTGVRIKNQAVERDEPAENDDVGQDARRGVDAALFRELPTNLQSNFKELAALPNCLDILIQNFLPSIYGNENIKKGILLMLASGLEKRGEKDNMKLRGDLNINIIGDPGTAKSTILREVTRFVPRCVYASGKMATAAGLTASVQRDAEQGGNPVIEAGALMLADGGVCCIDEFDKMDPKDMSAIHEAMEQQTISIAKAGIQAVLNARTSVLAACAPLNGKYHPQKTLRQNVNLTAPILSRFDLIFVIQDDTDLDELVASHILGMQDSADNEHRLSLSEEQLKDYLAVAKTLKPRMTRAAQSKLQQGYIALRGQDMIPGAQRHTRMTVRQLESLIRLSEATAKLHLSEEVTVSHVQIAFELFQNSLTKVTKGTIDFLTETEAAPEGETQGEARRTIRMEHAVFQRAAVGVVRYFEDEVQRKAARGIYRPVEFEQDDLKDYVVVKFFAEFADTEEVEDNYAMAGEILRRMIEDDLTLMRNTIQDQDGYDTQVISLHPTANVERYLAEANPRNQQARDHANNQYMPGDSDAPTEEVDLNADRFDAFVQNLNTN